MPPSLDLVSRASDGTPAAAESLFFGRPGLSSDGRLVVFSSAAVGLAPGENPAEFDVFVRDTVAGTTVAVGTALSGAPGNGFAFDPSISADGRFVAFWSSSTNLGPADGNGAIDVYLRDLAAGTTTRVSLTDGGGEANGYSYQPSVSADGRFVAFTSAATNLTAAADTNGAEDVYLHDRLTGRTELVSQSSAGVRADLGGQRPSVSADGRLVVFESFASNLIDGESRFGAQNVFLRDTLAGTTTAISRGLDGAQAQGASRLASISADGRFVVFQSDATTLTADADTGFASDIYLHDRATGQTTLVSRGIGGGPGDRDSTTPTISADGRGIVFASEATTLVADDANGFLRDIFHLDVATGTLTLISRSLAGAAADGDSVIAGLSADGTRIAFSSGASNLVPGDANGAADVFLFAFAGDPPPPPLAPDAPILTGARLRSSSGSTLAVTGTAVPGATVVLEADGTAIGTAQASASGIWSIATNGAPLAPGSYALAAVVVDPGGVRSAGSAGYALTVAPGGARLVGSSGPDALSGSSRADLLEGGAGDDLLTGGAGADALFGGAGEDTASYATAGAAVAVDLAAGGTLGIAAGDSYSSIERAIGSRFDDTLRGSDGANRLEGRDGADRIEGRGGDDVLIGGAGGDALDGGAGTDTVSYDDARAAVVVDLAGFGSAGDAAGDSYVSIERVTGTRFADTLVGAGLGERLEGGRGDDLLDGRDAADILAGGDGRDQLVGGTGDDVLLGGAGADRLEGGDGRDRFVFEALTDSARSRPDMIVDFEAGLDAIDLRAIGADAEGATGATAFAFIGAAAFTALGQVRAIAAGEGLWRIEANAAGTLTADLRIDVAATGGAPDGGWFLLT